VLTPATPGWPEPLVEIPTHPDDVAPRWAEHVQGVTSTDGCWFVTQEDGLWRFPMDRDLAEMPDDAPGVRQASLPEPGVEHLGDAAAHESLVYVAMEGTDPARVGVFDTALRFLGSAPLGPQATSGPWCAVNPLDGLLYSSSFRTDHLCAYERSTRTRHGSPGFVLQQVRDVPLSTADGGMLTLERVQGGAFSPRGHLYLTSDAPHGGLLGVDVVTGRREMHVVIPFEPGWPQQQVIEGLEVLDLADGRIPWMNGQVHVLVFDANHRRRDYVWFRHFAVGAESDRQHV
jgi:hypothetical protein